MEGEKRRGKEKEEKRADGGDSTSLYNRLPGCLSLAGTIILPVRPA